jgi:RNA polymerase sigma-70 factor (sigma-E family)
VEDGADAPDFAVWVAARQRSLFRTAWLLTGDTVTAEDLVQTALLRCWPKWARIRRMDDIDSYVRRVITNTYLSWRGRRWHGEVPTSTLPDLAAAALPDLDDQFVLLVALSRLPRRQRAVVVLRFADDLSEAQTAAALGCSVGTVKSQASRAIKTLRSDPSLTPEGDRA